MVKKQETRGRKPKPVEEKFVLNSLRMKPGEKDEVEKAANIKGVSFSEFARAATVKSARLVISKHD